MQWQGAAIFCSAVVNLGDAAIAAHTQRRELTPLGAVDNSARCTFIPAMAISFGSRLAGIKDSACSYDVARRALKENNSPQARQELLWRDGSWERRQAKFVAQYYDCYLGESKAPLGKAKKPGGKKHKKHKKWKYARR